MEAGVRSWHLPLVLGLVLLIRAPFWNQAIQGDDHTYLSEAAHALIDPLHPLHTKYVFLGEEVDLRGHTHPPLDAWVLAALIVAFGGVREIPFHAVYTVFSLIAAGAMWSLARRFSRRPLWATLLFIAVPVFVVNGNSLETDVPFLAFWMAAIALFPRHRVLSGLAMALAALTAFQAVFLTPILAVYVWLFHRREKAAWLTILVPPATYAAWQLFERLSSGALPASMLAGYLARFDIWNPKPRLALFLHAWFLVFPALVPGALALAWRKRREPETLFLLAWIGIFFAAALAVLSFGSARYLLPMAAPLALLASRLRPRWLAVGFAAQFALGLGLATVNYQHWDGYRRFAKLVPAARRVWVNGEWGLRYYLEANGALPLTRSQQLRAGEIVVSSELGSSVQVTAPVSLITSMEIKPAIPLRIIGLETHSGYSTIGKGIWPFGISAGPIDRVRALVVGERHPTREFLSLDSPEAAAHIVTGIWPDRWMARSGVVLLKSPAVALPLAVTFYISDKAAARHIALLLDGREVVSGTYPVPGVYTLATAGAVATPGETASVEIRADQTFSAPGDSRELGVVLISVGFRK